MKSAQEMIGALGRTPEKGLREPARGGAARLWIIGLLGLAFDIAGFLALRGSGAGLDVSQMSGFLGATLVTGALLRAGQKAAPARPRIGVSDAARSVIVLLMAVLLRGGVLALLIAVAGLSDDLALVITAALIAPVTALRCARFVFPAAGEASDAERWRATAFWLIAYTFVLRLVYLGTVNLLPEEAYYWNYAQHPALGYLDHPPMIAWLILAGTRLFGDGEFGVRIGAFLCWVATAWFVHGLARDLFSRDAALRCVLLAAVLPFFFVFGFFATPDAPLVACWAGTVFFARRALLEGKASAWWGVGVCIGLGMLSKYTIALLGCSIVVFVILDKPSRRWLLRPQPYGAALLAAALFSPVILWNANNGWESFVFQSGSRLSAPARFSLPLLVGEVLMLLTPLGLIGAMNVLCSPGWWRSVAGASGRGGRQWLFAAALTLTPLIVFVLFSLRHPPKPNWTGPLWISVLPALARDMSSISTPAVGRIAAFGRRCWKPTLVVTALIFAGYFHYLTLGLPGVAFGRAMNVFPVAWEEFGRAVEKVENQIEHPEGREPLVVGMDANFIASELAFYRRGGGEAVADTTSQQVFGRPGLMYTRWFAPYAPIGRTLLLVSRKAEDLDEGDLPRWFVRVGDVEERRITKEGKPAGSVFFRICEGFRRPDELDQGRPAPNQ